MNRKNQTYKLVAAALLSAIGIIIPLVSPFKILIEPASFTLASHVAIFIAMFISPSTAIFVALGTTLGFFLAGIFPIIVVFRALTHVIFAAVGAFVILKKPNILNSFPKSTLFSFCIGILHAVSEVVIVSLFYFSGNMQTNNFLRSVILLVGVGTLVHSMVDFGIAQVVWQPLKKVVRFGVITKPIENIREI